MTVFLINISSRITTEATICISYTVVMLGYGMVIYLEICTCMAIQTFQDQNYYSTELHLWRLSLSFLQKKNPYKTKIGYNKLLCKGQQ